jgi:hypothetical protein
MKKLFTLLVGVLMAGSAFGQKNWTSVIVNGDMEGNAPTYEAWENGGFDYAAVPADAWNSFWVHEWPGDQSKRYDGTANIVEDPDDPSNHCVKVVIRSRAEGEAAGNLTKDYTGNDGTYGSWDCQFFVYATQPIPAGKEIRLQLKVKAERDGSFETQNHSLPGTYIDATSFGNPKYTTEWTTLKLDPFTVSETQANAGFQSIAFNLCTDEDANVLYLDEIKLQIRDPQTDDGSDPGAWINFMRKGIYSDDHITGTSSEGDWECSNFTIQTPEQTKAPVVEVPGEPGVMAVHVPVRGYIIKEVEDLDEDGNQQFDEDGNVKMKSIYYWNDGTEIGSSAPARWTCQFFVSTLHKMVKGEKYRFKFRCKADKPTSLGTQAHTGPGKYVDYNTFGDESAFPISTEWTTFELGDYESVTDATKKVVPNGANGCQTITFDCVPLEGEDNNFYLIVEEFSFTEKYVTIEDRTLGTPEDLLLAVTEENDDCATTVDAASMLATFEVEDFSFLESEKDGIKLYLIIEPDDPEEEPTPSFSGLLTWTDGGFVGADGYYLEDSDMGVQIRLDDESIDGTKINFVTWNNPDAGISFADGKTIQTKLAISESGWYYVYNITLGSQETIDQLAGIKGVKQVKANNGLIYNLAGQRVDASYKGLVIKNGQKLIQK